jgi:NTP pyrophosphatase (non-canonical NTP hydrolase)
MNQSEFAELTARIRAFADARNWEKFHTPKNLSMAVAGEAGELVAEFQWLTSEESTLASLSPEQLQAIKLEIADVQIYLLRLADVLNVDIPAAVIEKMEINESRF